MKVLIAIPCINSGGTEIQTLNLIRTLIDAGYSITTLCYFEYDLEVIKEYIKVGSSLELLKLSRAINPLKLTNILRLKFLLYNPHVVHVQYMSPGALPIIAARLAGVKTIFATVHQPWTNEFHGYKAKILLRLASQLTTKFIAVSENAEKSWFGNSALYDLKNPKTIKRKHFTIHNSIDIALIDKVGCKVNRSKERENYGIENAFVIGAVSRLRHEKGIDLLISAFAPLASKNDQLRLLIVGGGPDEIQLKSLALQMGIDEKVVFTGNKSWEEAIELMSLMDIVVCPSRFEGFGLTAAEAMALGKPVVANNTGGLKEVVSNNETGLLVNAEKPGELSKAIQNLVENKLIVEKMGKAARIDVENRFSNTLFTLKIKQLYSQFVS